MKLNIKPYQPKETIFNKFEITVNYEADSGSYIEDVIHLNTEVETIALIKSLRADISGWSTVHTSKNKIIQESIEYLLVELGFCNEVRLDTIVVRWINKDGLKQDVEIVE